MVRSAELSTKVLQSIGLSTSEIDQVSYARTGRAREDAIIWNGLKVPVGDLQFKRSKICVSCYLENGVTLSDWDHIAAHTCPKHRVLLMDTCPCCGTTWSYQSEPLSCGCPTHEIIESQTPCSDEAADLVSNVIETENQDMILILGEMVRVIDMWKQTLGITSEMPDAESIAALANGEWSLEQQLRGVHPRVLLAPLLKSKHSQVREHGIALLRIANIPAGETRKIGDVWWPKSTAEKVLGIGRMTLKRLVEAGHLVATPKKGVQVDSLNHLLNKLSSGHSPSDSATTLSNLRSGKNRLSFSQILDRINSGAISQFGFEMSLGLTSFQCDWETKRPDTPHTAITVRHLAKQMNTNYESIRKLIKMGMIQGEKGTARNGVEWSISASEAERFHSSYIFTSELATTLGIGKNTVVGRLRLLGINPVSGPGIDAGFTYLFERSDIPFQSWEQQLTTIADQPAWKRPKNKKHKTSPTIGSAELAEQFRLSKRHIIEIVAQGWISPQASSPHRWVFSKTDVDGLTTEIEEQHIGFAEAAKRLGQTCSEFQKTWIDTGSLEVRKFGLRKLITTSDFEKIAKLWETYGTASSIGHQHKRPRWLAVNLEKMDLVTRTTHLGSGQKKVNLYDREENAFEKYHLS